MLRRVVNPPPWRPIYDELQRRQRYLQYNTTDGYNECYFFFISSSTDYRVILLYAYYTILFHNLFFSDFMDRPTILFLLICLEEDDVLYYYTYYYYQTHDIRIFRSSAPRIAYTIRRLTNYWKNIVGHVAVMKYAPCIWVFEFILLIFRVQFDTFNIRENILGAIKYNDMLENSY